ncbi:hypothetical protein BDE18_3068 [Paracoccus pantotrophus]|uniref:Uncharacterized protein n=1 Tax=Paracoccus pantotrophus TaxID=82367 RepID=A0ABX9S8R1_PARPN|nr:hypothetical protein BDE18_3068 [Paracoccus pantotrophus]
MRLRSDGWPDPIRPPLPFLSVGLRGRRQGLGGRDRCRPETRPARGRVDFDEPAALARACFRRRIPRPVWLRRRNDPSGGLRRNGDSGGHLRLPCPAFPPVQPGLGLMSSRSLVRSEAGGRKGPALPCDMPAFCWPCWRLARPAASSAGRCALVSLVDPFGRTPQSLCLPDPLTPFGFHQQPQGSGPYCRAGRAAVRPTPGLAGKLPPGGRRLQAPPDGPGRISSGEWFLLRAMKTCNAEHGHPRR